MGAYTGSRSVRRFTAVLTDDINTTEAIEIGDGGNARIYVDANMTSTVGTIYDQFKLAGSSFSVNSTNDDYVPAKDEEGTALTLAFTTTTAESLNLPVDIFAADKIKIVLDQTESMTVGIVVKS